MRRQRLVLLALIPLALVASGHLLPETGAVRAQPQPTATDTPPPADLYLPVNQNHWPERMTWEQLADVVLLIDTSTSMSQSAYPGGPSKMDAAIDACTALVSLFKDDDQAAVIGFNTDPTVLAQLTTDKSSVFDALRQLPEHQGSGTRIDLSLHAAHEELLGPRRRPAALPGIVLITDGQQADPPGDEAVRQIADEIRRAGITLVTIGLGDGVDQDLLCEIASAPELAFFTPDVEDLQEIYRVLVRWIPCP